MRQFNRQFLTAILTGSRTTPQNVDVIKRYAEHGQVYSAVFYVDGDRSRLYRITGKWMPKNNNSFAFIDAEWVDGTDDFLCKEVEEYEEIVVRYRYKE